MAFSFIYPTFKKLKYQKKWIVSLRRRKANYYWIFFINVKFTFKTKCAKLLS